MGMAASQARLLTITARMHDVEYKAQSIQNAKIQLSTQSDQVYQEYLEALDATTLTVDDINGNTITANFNNLVGKNGVETGNNYALRTSNGQLIVEDEVKDAYDEYDGNDPYEFAMMMTIALRFVPTLLEETEKIMAAQKARGADMESGGLMQRIKALIPVLIPLFVSAFRRAFDLATAMESRCYHGGEGRTKMKVLHLSKVDYITLIVCVLYLAAFITANILLPAAIVR